MNESQSARLPESQQQRGLLLLTTHQGPWDAAAGWLLKVTGRQRLFVVARPQKWASLDRWITKRRANAGAHTVWDDCPRELAWKCAELLKQDEAVVIFIDRDYWRVDSNCKLFGFSTRVPVELVAPLMNLNAEVVVGASSFVSSNEARTFILPHTGAELMTARGIATLVEKLVGEAPLQWHMFSPRWSADS